MMKWQAFFNKSKHFLLVIMLIVLTFCFAMFQGGFVSWFIFFTASPFLLYAVIFFFVREDIQLVERKIEPSHIESQQLAKVTVRIERKTHFPFIYMMVEELVGSEALIQCKEQKSGGLRFVGFAKTFESSYVLERLPRGEHRYVGMEIIFCDFFGWAQKRIKIDKEQTILVYPRVKEMSYATLQRKVDIGTMLSPYSIVKDTSMAVGLREYVPGDRFSWIHWKSFAKNQTLQSKEFEDRKSQELLLILQADSSLLFEEKIEFVASMLQTIVHGRGEITFITASHQLKKFPLIRSEKQLDEVMQHLATIQPTMHEKMHLLDQFQLKNIATLLYVTSHISEQLWLTLANMAQHCICFVVAEQQPVIPKDMRSNKQINIVYVNTNDYYHVFTEVMKP